MIIAVNHTIARDKEAAARFIAATVRARQQRVAEPGLRPVWANAGQERQSDGLRSNKS